ncbi:hypothetical protein A0H81_10621 [Grifola frondosa]|uniref:Uncharacterized protein n=1 Tax=Grifola frondosa TaxID=5627 RepID=A0A1C7LY68_GRIFR|nr:hypothetical protein A0H81_10621 [Grifola frondosa]
MQLLPGTRRVGRSTRPSSCPRRHPSRSTIHSRRRLRMRCLPSPFLYPRRYGRNQPRWQCIDDRCRGGHKGSTPAPSAIAPVKSSPDSPRKQSIDAEKSTEKPLPGTPSSVPLSQHRSQVSTPKPFAVTPKPADISSPIEAAPVVCIEITRKVVIGWASRWTRWGSRRCSARAGSRPTARCRDRRRRASRPPHNALPREPLCRIIAI